MIRKCEFEGCNVEFEGSPQSHYCPEHRLFLQREAHKRYDYKNKQFKKDYMRDYYRQNRTRILELKKRREEKRLEREGQQIKDALNCWKIEYLRSGDLWTWKATKGNVTLEAHRNFYSLRTAQKDCMLAIG